jgi:hypothetical protein
VAKSAVVFRFGVRGSLILTAGAVGKIKVYDCLPANPLLKGVALTLPEPLIRAPILGATTPAKQATVTAKSATAQPAGTMRERPSMNHCLNVLRSRMGILLLSVSH